MPKQHKNPFGQKSGHLVHIDDVPAGLNCGCICPACNHPLVAKKGNKNVHHFSHSRGSECGSGLETTLHLLAKDILAQAKTITLPPVRLWSSERWEIAPSTTIKFETVQLENRIGEIIPDLVLTTQGRPLLVEIAVTHYIDAHKQAKVVALGISALEISLGDLDDIFDREALRERILHEIAGKEWIYNAKAEAAKQDILTHLPAFATKRQEQQGFGHERFHGGRVYGCPEKCGTTKNGVPYAVTGEDCIHCEFDFYGGSSDFHDRHIWCTGHTGIASYQDFLVWKSRRRKPLQSS